MHIEDEEYKRYSDDLAKVSFALGQAMGALHSARVFILSSSAEGGPAMVDALGKVFSNIATLVDPIFYPKQKPQPANPPKEADETPRN
jgi:hypothetical protein